MRNKIIIILAAVMGVTLLGFTPSLYNFREGKFLIAEWTLLMFVVVILIKNVWLRVFVGWCVLRHVLGFFEIAFIGQPALIKYFKVSYVSLMSMFVYVMAYHTFITNIKFTDIKKVYDAICVILLIHCLLTILQYFGVWIFVYPKTGYYAKVSYLWGQITIADCVNVPGNIRNIFVGLMDNTNTSGALLALGAPVFFRKKWLIYLPILLATAYITKCLGGIVPIIVCLSIFMIIKLKKHSYPLMPLIVALFVIYLSHCENIKDLLTFSGRIPILIASLKELVPYRLFMGYGLGMFKIVYIGLNNIMHLGLSQDHYAHNEYLQVLVELGLIGLVTICGYLIHSLYQCITKKFGIIITLALIAIILNAAVFFTFHTTVAWLALTYFGIIEIIKKEKKQYGTV